MYGRPRAGLQCQLFLDAGRDIEVLYMPGTSGCFFLQRLTLEREQCARTVRILGLDGESAGGKGPEVTLGYQEEYQTYIILHVRIIKSNQ